MRSRSVRPLRSALLSVLLLAFAGCASPSDPAPEDADAAASPPAPTSVPWTLTDCLHAVWYASAPAAALQARVPEGFQARAGPTGMGSLGFEAFVCGSGSGLDGELAGLQYGSLFIGVTADDGSCDGLPGGCYVKTDVLVPDAARRAWLQAAGVAAHNGTAAVTVDAAGTWTTSLVMDDVGGFGMQGTRVTPPSGGQPLAFREFMQATGGLNVWTATATDASTAPGAGAWSADPGTWVANEVGMVGPAQFSAGTWSFEDGNITVPAAVPGAAAA